MFGSFVANGYGAANAPPPVSALYSELLPAFGRPTRPKRSIAPQRVPRPGERAGGSSGLVFHFRRSQSTQWCMKPFEKVKLRRGDTAAALTLVIALVLM